MCSCLMPRGGGNTHPGEAYCIPGMSAPLVPLLLGGMPAQHVQDNMMDISAYMPTLAWHICGAQREASQLEESAFNLTSLPLAQLPPFSLDL